MEVDVLEYRDVGPGRVAESHVLVANVAVDAGRHQSHGRFDVGGLGRFVQDFEDALRCAEGTLNLTVHLAEAGDGRADEGRVEQESKQLADFEMVGSGIINQRGSAPQNEDDAAGEADDDERHEAAPKQITAQRRLHHAVERGTVALGFEPLVGEGFHRVDGLEGFLHNGIGVGQLLLSAAGQGADFAPKQPRRQDDGRKGEQHKQRQLHRYYHDSRDADEQGEYLPEQLGDGERKRVLNLGYVRGNARGDGPHAVLLEEGDGQLHKLGVERQPDVAHRELAHLREKPDAPKREKPLAYDNGEQHIRKHLITAGLVSNKTGCNIIIAIPTT